MDIEKISEELRPTSGADIVIPGGGDALPGATPVLRPMSEAPIGVPLLVKFDDNSYEIFIVKDNDDKEILNRAKEFLGWILAPGDEL